MRPFIPLALIAALSGCASLGTVQQTAEKADSDASFTYVAIAEAVNAYETVPGADMAKGESIKLEAWKALTVERNAYTLGQAIDLTALTSILSEAEALSK